MDSKTVVIADDHETLVMYLSILMRRMGFAVIPAGNGAEVMQIIETMCPDLIITDRMMPVMDGVTLLKQVKGDPRYAQIPVIVATAYYDRQVFKECMALGAVGCLAKPVRINDLQDLLQRCIFYPNNVRHRNLRVSYGCRVTVDCQGEQHDYHAVTLSEQGVFLRTQSPLPVGTRLKVSLPLSSGQYLNAFGEVIYHRGVFSIVGNLDPGMAVKFEGVSEDNVEALRKFIMELLAGDLLIEQQNAVIDASLEQGS